MLTLPRAPAAAEPGYHHGDLRRALIDAALDQLADGGSASLGLRELARRVGVSSAAPYRHFKNREELLAAVAEAGFARLGATLEAAALSRPAELHLAAMGRAYVRFAELHQALFRLMFSPEIDTRRNRAVKLAAEAAFAPLAAAAAREAGRRDPLEVGYAAWALAHGLAALILDQQLPDDAGRIERLVAGITASFVAGVRAAARVPSGP